VRHDVVGQAGEDRLAGQVAPRVVAVGAEVAEEDGDLGRVVEGVLAFEPVRQHPQSLSVLEHQTPPQRLLEALEHAHGHGIDHLLVEEWVRLGRLEALAHEHGGVLQVDRPVQDLLGRVVVDHLDPRALGAGEERLVRDRDHDAVAGRPPLHRVVREDLQRPPLREVVGAHTASALCEVCLCVRNVSPAASLVNAETGK